MSHRRVLNKKPHVLQDVMIGCGHAKVCGIDEKTWRADRRVLGREIYGNGPVEHAPQSQGEAAMLLRRMHLAKRGMCQETTQARKTKRQSANVKSGSSNGTSSNKSNDGSKVCLIGCKKKSKLLKNARWPKHGLKWQAVFGFDLLLSVTGRQSLLSTIPDETIRGYCSECELVLPDSRSQMIEDGKGLCPPSRGNIALGSLACETGYENDLIEMGVLADDGQEACDREKASAPRVYNCCCCFQG